MTTREFYLASIEVFEHYDYDELADKARELIAALDKRNDSRKSADSKAKREVADRKSAVYAVLSSSLQTREQIAATVGCSVGQAQAALTALVKGGLATKTEVKLPDKTKRMVYSIAE